MEQRISLVTLGVRDVVRARNFYEALGWRGQTVGDTGDETVFFHGGDPIIWDRGRGFGVAQCIAFRKCVVTVEQSLEGGVVLLEGQEDVELTRH